MLKVPSTIEKFESRADNTWKLIIGTQELSQEDIAELAMQKGQLGHFVFSAQDNITDADVPTEQIEFRGEKTPGQRLRGVLYKLWENDHAGFKDFETFYRSRMERLIEQIKEKLR